MFGQSEQIFDKLNQNKTNLADQCLLTITLIAFCGFMRSVKNQDFDVQICFFSSTYIFIEKIKADIYRERIITFSLKKKLTRCSLIAPTLRYTRTRLY